MAWQQTSVRWIAMALILMAPRRAIAAPPDALPAPAATLAPASQPVDKKAEAEAHVDKGNELFDRGDLGVALAEFLLARQLHPLWKATYNAGQCLQKLRRYDEALEMFEAVLREFGETMPATNKETAQRKAAKLRELVGWIDVNDAELGATISIDGRDRGQYPTVALLRIVAGAHIVRVSKAGFEPFEKSVDVAGGQVTRVPSRLFALTRSGRLHVVEQGGKALAVVVDGSAMGKTPWNGQLAIGSHVVLLRGEENVGTPPVSVNIELDQTIQLTLVAEELTARLRVEPLPLSASVAIDAVTVGHGIWEGRLRAGAHRVEVAAQGFLPSTREMSIARGEEQALGVELERDPSSPFWTKPPRRPRFVAELDAAVALVPTFGGDVASGCDSACRSSVGAGGYGVLRGGYELGSGFGFGVAAGYLTAMQTMVDRSTTLQPVARKPMASVPADRGIVDDVLKLRGALIGAWAGWSLFTPVPIHLRLTAGSLLGSVEDTRTGKFVPGGSRLVLSNAQCIGHTSKAEDVPCFPVGPVAEAHTTSFFYVAPEVRVGLPLGRHFEVTLGFEVPIFISPSQPRWGQGYPVNTGSNGAGTYHLINAGSAGAATFANDALVGRAVVLFAPSVGARVDF